MTAPEPGARGEKSGDETLAQQLRDMSARSRHRWSQDLLDRAAHRITVLSAATPPAAPPAPVVSNEEFIRIALRVFRAVLAERGMINITDTWDDHYELSLRAALARPTVEPSENLEELPAPVVSEALASDVLDEIEAAIAAGRAMGHGAWAIVQRLQRLLTWDLRADRERFAALARPAGEVAP